MTDTEELQEKKDLGCKLAMAKGHRFQNTVHGECSQENHSNCSTIRMGVMVMSVVIVIPLHLVKEMVCVKGHLIEPRK